MNVSSALPSDTLHYLWLWPLMMTSPVERYGTVPKPPFVMFLRYNWAVTTATQLEKYQSQTREQGSKRSSVILRCLSDCVTFN